MVDTELPVIVLAMFDPPYSLFDGSSRARVRELAKSVSRIVARESATHREAKGQHLVLGSSAKGFFDEAVETLGTEVEADLVSAYALPH